jgi:hypothetical protein
MVKKYDAYGVGHVPNLQTLTYDEASGFVHKVESLLM